MLDLYPLDWSGIHNTAVSAGLVSVAWVLVSVTSALSLGIWALVSRHLSRGNFVFSAGACVACVWVVCEKLRAMLVMLLLYSPVSLWTPHLDFHNLGYIAPKFNLLAQLLPVGGASLISFVIVFCSWGFFTLWQSKKYILLCGVLAGIVCLNALVSLPNTHLEGNPTHVQILTSSFSPDFSSTGIAARVSDIQKVLASTTAPNSVLLLSENSYYLDSLVYNQPIGTVPPVLNALIIDSSPRAGGHYLYYYRPDTAATVTYQKILLMPQGEYLMSFEYKAAKLFKLNTWLQSVRGLQNPKRGKNVEVYTLNSATKIGGLLCSELVSPYLARSLVRQGATFIVIPSSHAVIHGSLVLKRETLEMAQTRAIELNRFIVIAGNGTNSLVVSNQGAIVASIEPEQMASLTDVTVQNTSALTFYARFGEWIIWVSVLGVIAALCLRVRPARAKR